MHRFFAVFLVTILFSAAPFTGVALAQGTDHYSVELQGFVWNKTTLQALVITADNESWWNALYLNSTLRAIGQWNDALAAFGANYSDFAYLSEVKIEPTVSGQMQPGFDIYINWTQSPLSNTSNEVGLSQIYADTRSTITNCTVSLAAHTDHGDALDDWDMQNIALHELGHSLGLGHCNYTGDLMYAIYTMGSGGESVSTLDAYGVAQLFAWTTNQQSFYPVKNWLTDNSVSLPSYIAFGDLPISPENAAPQTLTDNPVVQFFILVWGILIHPEILAVVIVVVAVFVVLGLIAQRRR